MWFSQSSTKRSSAIQNNRWLCNFAQGDFAETALNTKRLCSLAQLRRASPTPIRQISQSLDIFVVCRGICKAEIFAVADAFLMRQYLRYQVIRCCRCFLGCVGICKTKIFDIADAFFLPSMYNCIFNLLISRLVDASAQKTASSTCLFQDLQMLPHNSY